MNKIFRKQKSTVPQSMMVHYIEVPFTKAREYFGEPHQYEAFENGDLHKAEWRYELFNGENIRISYNAFDEYADFARGKNIKAGKIFPMEKLTKMEILGNHKTVQEFVEPILKTVLNNACPRWKKQSTIIIIFEREF